MNTCQSSNTDISTDPAAKSGGRAGIIAILAVCLAGMAAYWNSFSGSFIYDDRYTIVENKALEGSPLHTIKGFGYRHLAAVTFWANRKLGGLDVWDYHMVNLCVHVLAGLTLMGLLRRLFLSPRLASRLGQAAEPLAAAAAVLWLVHPIQTESVTYIIQRCESLMGLLALLSMYLAVRGMESSRPTGWFFASLAAMILGAFCKEEIIVVPVVILACDIIFYSSVRTSGFLRVVDSAIWRGLPLYAGLALSVCMLATVAYRKLAEAFMETDVASPTLGAVFGDAGPSVWAYAITQPQVITHYLTTTFWPENLCIDYCWPAVRGVSEAISGIIVIAILLAATIFALCRRPAWGFAGLWFFLWLAPRSSVIVRPDLAVEHRMYLALAAVTTVTVVVVYLVGRRLLGNLPRRSAVAIGCAALAVCATALIVRTANRNSDYASEITMGQSTIQNHWGSRNPRAFYNLGVAWQEVYDRTHEIGAIKRAGWMFARTCDLSPRFDLAWFRTGWVYDSLAATERDKIPLLLRAIVNYQKAADLVRGNPRYQKNLVKYLNNQGEAWRNISILRAGPAGPDRESMEKAEDCFKECMRLQPDDPAGWFNMGCLMMQDGKPEEAAGYFRKAAELKPDNAQAFSNLGAALARAGKFQEAIESFNKALAIDPQDGQALSGRAMAIEQMKKQQRPTPPASGP